MLTNSESLLISFAISEYVMGRNEFCCSWCIVTSYGNDDVLSMNSDKRNMIIKSLEKLRVM